MSRTFEEQLKQAKWEFNNNPRTISVLIYGIDMSVESIILICPSEYASSFFDNYQLRRLAIEQRAFKLYPEQE